MLGKSYHFVTLARPTCFRAFAVQSRRESERRTPSGLCLADALPVCVFKCSMHVGRNMMLPTFRDVHVLQICKVRLVCCTPC